MAVTIHGRDENEYRVVCKGVSVTEFMELQREIEAELSARTLRRNPFDPAFDAKTVHEIIVRLGATGAAGYVGKKIVDLIADIVKRKLKQRDDGPPRSVTIYDYRGQPTIIVELKKPKRKL